METTSEVQFELVDLITAIHSCARSKSAGSLVSTSQAVEELRIISGDFVTSDETAANAIAEVALAFGCTVVFDEQPGAEILRLP
ncbi:MAG: hypothetical protein K0S21_2712 [Rhizobiaceae bacterium]|jgi:hypothetical protein|nr:hypothetical protein [Rhizobiaceae bacterium]